MSWQLSLYNANGDIVQKCYLSGYNTINSKNKRRIYSFFFTRSLIAC